MRRRALFLVALAAALVIVVGGVGAGVCHFTSVDCHILGNGTSLNEVASAGKGKLVLPAGFASEIVASGLKFPTDFAFLPDGRLLVSEKDGLVRLVKNGTAQATPFLDLSSEVNTKFFRGLIAIAVDPDFEQNGYIYALYTHEDHTGKAEDPRTARLSRFTATGDTASPGSEKVLLGAAGSGSCDALPATSDCLPSNLDHDGSQIEFAPDGTIFVTTGDGGGHDEEVEPTALRAQDVDSLAGKLLHITRDGLGLPGNPFWNGDAHANRSKVFAYGMRNPFRMTLRPGSLEPYVGDVGSHTQEEIDAVPKGANLGWPCYEGLVHSPVYESAPLCTKLYAKGDSAVVFPIIAYPHAGSVSVTGGSFYSGTRYPAAYRGAYFYGDFIGGWIRYAQVGGQAGSGAVKPVDFATGASGPVAIEPGPDGDLYYLSLDLGQVVRITYPAG